MTLTDLAWAAGFFDGEGCIAVSRERNRRYYHLTVMASQKKKEPLEDLQRIFGAGYLYDHRRHSKVWAFYLTGVQAEVALRKMRPFLKVKQYQADLAFNFRQLFGRNQKPLSDWDLGIREWYYRRLREAKR